MPYRCLLPCQQPWPAAPHLVVAHQVGALGGAHDHAVDGRLLLADHAILGGRSQLLRGTPRAANNQPALYSARAAWLADLPGHVGHPLRRLSTVGRAPPHPRVWLVCVHVLHPVLPRLVVLHPVQAGGILAKELQGVGVYF